jgi:putative redox protein
VSAPVWTEIVHRITGPGRVEADFGSFTIPTDHPAETERGVRPPEPWCVFLASIGTCMASFVAERCETLGLDPREVTLVQRHRLGEAERFLDEVEVEIRVPPDTPPEHREALVEAAAACTVKRVLEAPPSFRIEVKS